MKHNLWILATFLFAFLIGLGILFLGYAVGLQEGRKQGYQIHQNVYQGDTSRAGNLINRIDMRERRLYLNGFKVSNGYPEGSKLTIANGPDTVILITHR